jgi:hypothetical protein
MTMKMTQREAEELLLMNYKIRAIRDHVIMQLDALAAEIEAKLPDEKEFKRKLRDPSVILKELLEDKKNEEMVLWNA